MRVWLHTIIFLLLSVLSETVSAVNRLQPEQADSLAAHGQMLYSQFRYLDALDVFDQALSVAQSTDNHDATVRILLYIGNIHMIFDNYEQALHYYQQCRQQAEDAGRDDMHVSACYNMLHCYAMLGQAELAQQCYTEMTGLHLGDPKQDRFYGFTSQALLAQARGDVRASLFFHRQALEYAVNHDMGPMYQSAQMGRIGTLEEKLGNTDAAIECYLQSAQVASEHNSLASLCTCYERLASLYRQLNNDSASMRYQRLYVQLNDSLFSAHDYNNSSGRLVKSEMRHNTQMISSLSDRVSKQFTVIIVFLVMLILLIVLLVIIFRQNRNLVATQRVIIGQHHDMDMQLQQQSRLGSAYLKVVGGIDPVLPEETDDVAADAPLLTPQQTEVLLAAIVQVLEDSDTICNSDFSLQQLANSVGSNTRYVSWAINASYGKSFKTILNEYRIREATRRLTDHEHYGHLTLAALAEQIGYKSPTSFNTAFKRILGMTPAAYQKLAASDGK